MGREPPGCRQGLLGLSACECTCPPPASSCRSGSHHTCGARRRRTRTPSGSGCRCPSYRCGATPTRSSRLRQGRAVGGQGWVAAHEQVCARAGPAAGVLPSPPAANQLHTALTFGSVGGAGDAAGLQAAHAAPVLQARAVLVVSGTVAARDLVALALAGGAVAAQARRLAGDAAAAQLVPTSRTIVTNVRVVLAGDAA